MVYLYGSCCYCSHFSRILLHCVNYNHLLCHCLFCLRGKFITIFVKSLELLLQKLFFANTLKNSFSFFLPPPSLPPSLSLLSPSSLLSPLQTETDRLRQRFLTQSTNVSNPNRSAKPQSSTSSSASSINIFAVFLIFLALALGYFIGAWYSV